MERVTRSMKAGRRIAPLRTVSGWIRIGGRGRPLLTSFTGPGNRGWGGLRRGADWYWFRVRDRARHTGIVTTDQMALISADPQVMHGQAVIAGTRVPVSVILDCLAAGMAADEILAEYPAVTVAGVRAAAAYGAALAREELLPLPQSR